MAKWSVSAATAQETQQAQLWSEEAFNEARVNSFWANHIGQGPMNVVQEDPRLTREAGDLVNLNLVVDLSGRGLSTTSSSALEGNEASVTRYGDSVQIGRLRQAIRTDGRLDEQRSAFDMREQMANLLAYWAQRNLIDLWMFRKLSGTTMTDSDGTPNTVGEAATANSNIIYANQKTATADLEAGDVMTLDLLERAKTSAMLGQVNGTTTYKIKPLQIDGQPYYLFVGHPAQRFAMRQDSRWQEAVLNARERAASNPIFSGADGLWDGVILKFHDLVTTGSDGGASGSLNYANGLFLGLQAGAYFPAQPAPDWVEKTFDYSEEFGIATGMTQGFDKLRYNSIDFAVIAIRTAIETF